MVGAYTQGLSQALASFQASHSDTIASVVGYWEYLADPQTALLANQSVSSSRQTMRTTLTFWKNASVYQCQEDTRATAAAVFDHETALQRKSRVL